MITNVVFFGVGLVEFWRIIGQQYTTKAAPFSGKRLLA